MASRQTSRSHGPSLTLICLGLLAFSLYLHLRLAPYADDDAYIHMRVARHLWDAGLPYFNIGEPVMASTSPLWVILTSPAAIFGPLQPLAVAVFNAFGVVAAALSWSLLYGQIARVRPGRELTLAPLVVFFTLVPSSIGLMETPLALLFVGLGLLALVRDSSFGVPLLCASAFIRPECAVFAASGIVWKIAHKRPWSVREVLIGAATIGALAWFQIHFFNGVYPHTAAAKEVVYRLTGAEFVRLLFIGSYGGLVSKLVLPPVVCAAIVMLVVILLSQKKMDAETISREVSSFPLMVVLLPALMILSVYALKMVLIFPWYAALFLVPIHLAILRDAFRLSGRGRLLAMALLIPWFATTVCVVVGSRNFSYLPFFESGARARKLKHLGDWLALEHGGDTVAAPEIGALGFAFTGKIEDTVGLASPGSLRFHPLKVPEQRPTGFHGGVPARLIQESLPRVIIGLDVFMTDFMNSPISERYEMRKVPPVLEEDRERLGTAKVFGADNLIIAIRKER